MLNNSVQCIPLYIMLLFGPCICVFIFLLLKKKCICFFIGHLVHLFLSLFNGTFCCFGGFVQTTKHLIHFDFQCFMNVSINVFLSYSREFTHRVKSVSMAKFTSQEVEALQNGGNQVQV